eukprot:21268-Heterococcus_DN1.PRE.1
MHFAVTTGLCSAGYYCDGGASVPTQHRVPIGYYSHAGAVAPVPCAPGTYVTETGQTDCLPTIPGYYAPAQATVNQTVCPAGTYCTGKNALPELCPGNASAAIILEYIRSRMQRS